MRVLINKLSQFYQQFRGFYHKFKKFHQMTFISLIQYLKKQKMKQLIIIVQNAFSKKI
ncbi:unnamed protein product [Paramecium primaurelia]|uniref:Uncharacterized protein n=1 Tax=Paramecium primaurelia TaxID=5886 RepID=A0A8S1NLS8_PARPR|nr:unnamed protein product [Paramecium primaurelia]